MNEIHCCHIENFTTSYGVRVTGINVRYQLYGKALGSAPIIVINHALTGNSQLIGTSGWWNDTVGDHKPIDTQRYTILAMNIPGNGFASDENDFITNYEHWAAVDVAKIFNLCIGKIGIAEVYALVGCSVGGGIAWEMAVLNPELFRKLVVISADWKSSDWVIGNCLLQEQILKNSNNPLHDARLHAMLCYRTPQSLKMKFDRSTHPPTQLYNVESWLLHHGEKLTKRFSLASYKLMNQLVKTIDISREKGSFAEAVQNLDADIHIISADSDLYFVPDEDRQTAAELKQLGKNVTHNEIKSVHGHDSFLIEHEQLAEIFSNLKIW
ncbi:MAG: alpha/beta fold hydrolase [Capnocytophaga sp.]|nr:alpha/beta fold hydrolase [Capnocytophaga sp.]